MNDRDILFTMSMDKGLTFYVVKNLGQKNYESTYANMLAIGENVYIPWYDKEDSDLDVYYRKGTDRGQTFSNKTNVS